MDQNHENNWCFTEGLSLKPLEKKIKGKRNWNKLSVPLHISRTQNTINKFLPGSVSITYFTYYILSLKIKLFYSWRSFNIMWRIIFTILTLNRRSFLVISSYHLCALCKTQTHCLRMEIDFLSTIQSPSKYNRFEMFASQACFQLANEKRKNHSSFVGYLHILKAEQ